MRLPASRPTPPAPLPEGKGEEDRSLALAVGAHKAERSDAPSPFPSGRGAGGVGLLREPVLAHLAGRSGATDCTLPELYRALADLGPAPSIGAFHDCLRTLHADGALALHSWTGPLYALPEPQFALLVGHGIAFYASLKSGQWSVVSGQ